MLNYSPLQQPEEDIFLLATRINTWFVRDLSVPETVCYFPSLKDQVLGLCSQYDMVADRKDLPNSRNTAKGGIDDVYASLHSAVLEDIKNAIGGHDNLAFNIWTDQY